MSFVYVAVAAVAVQAYGVYEQHKAAKDMQEIQNQQLTLAKESAQKQAEQSDQAINRANQKTPDVAGILSGAQRDAKGAGGGTMLTGPVGVDPNTSSLGKTSLLGG